MDGMAKYTLELEILLIHFLVASMEQLYRC